ncbi:adenosylcobinamide-phosphate synthase CbiB [Pseudooceanicola sp. MF1-13]|uniref:adenosylcobinamide-phosphate synthase CbiB n=1 Tax=Pseudooceanicola sp. MF1-13 TaxID=3379095 RepID=UPI003891DF93
MILTAALILDAIFGEPEWLWSRIPHPAVLIGKAIGRADQMFNKGAARKTKGVMFCIVLTLSALIIGGLIQAFGPIVEAIAAAILLAQRSLTDHVRDVANGLRISLASGRVAVARIVGRDTRDMDQPAVARAAIESGAENFGDGVIAPIFWFVVGGLPGMLAYKAVNTADSMIGYRTERHADFGWASARFDDLLNYLPARLTALLIPSASLRWPDWSALKRDAALHRSPNAGWPEAAMAQTLNVALSGPRAYHGTWQDFPWVNGAADRMIGPNQIDRATTLLWRAWAIVLGFSILFTL